MSCRERGPAAARGGGIRVADHELRPVEALAVIDFGPGEVLDAHRVDEQLDAQILDAGVAFLDLLVELKAVLQARAAATLHEYAQHQLGIALAENEVADLAGGGIGELQGGAVHQGFRGAHPFGLDQIAYMGSSLGVDRRSGQRRLTQFWPNPPRPWPRRQRPRPGPAA